MGFLGLPRLRSARLIKPSVGLNCPNVSGIIGNYLPGKGSRARKNRTLPLIAWFVGNLASNLDEGPKVSSGFS